MSIIIVPTGTSSGGPAHVGCYTATGAHRCLGMTGTSPRLRGLSSSRSSTMYTLRCTSRTYAPATPRVGARVVFAHATGSHTLSVTLWLGCTYGACPCCMHAPTFGVGSVETPSVADPTPVMDLLLVVFAARAQLTQPRATYPVARWHATFPMVRRHAAS